MIYAAYKGETPLIVDTAEKVAEYLQIKVESVKWKATPAGQKRTLKANNGLVIIKFHESGADENN